jgi:hypothetical protein
MSLKEYGTEFGASIVWYTSQPTAERDGGVWQYRYRGWCARANAFSLIPAEGSLLSNLQNADRTGIVAGELANLKLRGASILGNASPEKVDIELLYKRDDIPSGSWMGHTPGEVEQRAETTVRDLPVQVGYNSSIASIQDAAIIAAQQDIDTIPVPGLKYYYSTYLTNFEWTEANMITVGAISIAEVGAPSGMTGATALKWILQGKSIENVGAGMVKVSEEWEYSPVGWTTPAAT